MAKLIFIDDNIVDHRIFQYLAEKYESSTAITYSVQPDNILDYLETHKTELHRLPDVIIIDLRMHGFDGYDFLKSFSRLVMHLQKKIKVYVISFSLHPKDVNLTRQYPFITQYLLKPLTDDHIKNILAIA